MAKAHVEALPEQNAERDRLNEQAARAKKRAGDTTYGRNGAIAPLKQLNGYSRNSRQLYLDY